MEFYFVYSSGGGAGDWGGIDRIFRNSMPEYFKNHILLKFGDIFFNHRSSASIIKPSLWRTVDDAKAWIIGNTHDASIRTYQDMIMDVGTTKIVSYITSAQENISAMQLIARFNRIMDDEGILDKYSKIILNSDIKNAVTFDIPNLFKVRSQMGNVSRDLFKEGNCKQELIDACARFANYTYNSTGKDPDRLLTIINLSWANNDVDYYLGKLNYTPTKIAIGGAAFFNRGEMGAELRRMNSHIDFGAFKKVHFLGCGGQERAAIIKRSLGNNHSFSVDNTTPYNRAIDGSVDGRTQSGYFDYRSGSLYRIMPSTRNEILSLHESAVNMGIACFSMHEMQTIIDGILQHQSKNSSQYTYECRAKLIIHNFDVFRYLAQ